MATATDIKIFENDGWIQIIATGGEVDIDFDFPIYDDTFIQVIETDLDDVETTLVLNTDYTVPPASVLNQSGGIIQLTALSFPTGAIAGHRYTILLAVPYERISDFQPNGDLFTDVVNLEYDLIAQQIQQLKRSVDRSLKISDSDELDGSLNVPLDKEGKFLLFDALGNLTVSEIGMTSDSIADGAVTTDKIFNGAVTTIKIANDAVTLDKMAQGVIGNLITYNLGGDPILLTPGISGYVLTSQGVGSALTYTEKLPDDSVTLAKLATGTVGNLITYDALGDPAYLAPGTSGYVLTSQGVGQPLVYVQPTSDSQFIVEKFADNTGSFLQFGSSEVDITTWTDFSLIINAIVCALDQTNLELLYSTDGGATFLATHQYYIRQNHVGSAVEDVHDAFNNNYIVLNVPVNSPMVGGLENSGTYSGTIDMFDLANSSSGAFTRFNGRFADNVLGRSFCSGIADIDPAIVNTIRVRLRRPAGGNENMVSGSIVLMGKRLV